MKIKDCKWHDILEVCKVEIIGRSFISIIFYDKNNPKQYVRLSRQIEGLNLKELATLLLNMLIADGKGDMEI